MNAAQQVEQLRSTAVSHVMIFCLQRIKAQTRAHASCVTLHTTPLNTSTMDDPFLAGAGTPNAEGDPPRVERDDAQVSQHFCSRCSGELEHRPDYSESTMTHRHKLIHVAIFLAIIIFVLGVGAMFSGSEFRDSSLIELCATIWSDVTIATLAILLHTGRFNGWCPKLLGRTTAQIYVLCGLGISWIVLIIPMVARNKEACYDRHTTNAFCGLYTTSHVLSWFLFITLFVAAYAAYRRAVTIHGTAPVPVPRPPRLVPAWRLSDVADGEGTIKI
ncbi:hypothetical protein B0H10DRAFT_2021286 [Mycena sp. CBHHK59/15]|nr:hypothetical protein B0H10DRAFT_2021286 [Mycena sp. CBHHK59/15]